MFGTSSRSQWRAKGNNSFSISKDTSNKLEAVVSVYQLQSDQLGLVPQFSGKLTRGRIWDAQFMVDHLSDLTYVKLIRIKSQK